MNNKLKMLVEGALMVAIAQVLSLIKIFEMPWGGSITLAMLPIILFAVRWGLGSGVLAGFVFGVLQFMFDGGFAIGWQSIIGDYLLAFTALGIAGIFVGKKFGAIWGTLVGCFARFLVHYVVGATVWAAYMPEIYLGMSMSTPWVYSLIYNALYMLPSTVITLIIFLILYPTALNKYIVGADIKR